jgi:transcriptional regulator with XRE-family HTH domain
MSTVDTSALATGSMSQTTAVWVPLGGKPAAAKKAAPPPLPSTCPEATARPLHRLCEVRRREGLSRRMIARHLGMSVRDVKNQEQPSADISLSDLYRWQEVLKVPTAELLKEPEAELSPPVQLRARLLRVMKTVQSIQTGARQVSIRRLATMLAEQLIEMMPELKETAPWPVVGSRRSRRELGQAFIRGLSMDSLSDLDRRRP